VRTLRRTDIPTNCRLDAAYIVSRFPKITETFIIDEVVELQRQGLHVRVWSLLRTSEGVVQPAAIDLVDQATFAPRSLARLISGQVRWLARRPRTVLTLWLRAMALNRASWGEWVKSLATVAVAMTWAADIASSPPRRLHAHWATHPALAAYVMAHLLNVPYGITAHAHDIYGKNGMLEEKLRAADLVVTISDFNRELLQRRFLTAAGNVRVLRCGVDRTAFAPTPLRPASAEGINILCVASLTDYKGHRYLLEAVALLRDRGIATRCRLVGDGPLSNDLRRQAEALHLGAAVVFEGRQTAPRVRRLLEECDVFVLPSIVLPSGVTEGIPVALMEAMATGRPVVASRLSGIPELVIDGHTGLLVPPGDPEALAAAIATLIDREDLRRRLSRGGPDRIAQDFDRTKNVAVLRGWLSASAFGPEFRSLLTSER